MANLLLRTSRVSRLAILAGVVALGSAAGPARASDEALAAARAWRSAHGARILSEFAELLRIPNTAQDPAGLERNAEAI